MLGPKRRLDLPMRYVIIVAIFLLLCVLGIWYIIQGKDTNTNLAFVVVSSCYCHGVIASCWLPFNFGFCSF